MSPCAPGSTSFLGSDSGEKQQAGEKYIPTGTYGELVNSPDPNFHKEFSINACDTLFFREYRMIYYISVVFVQE